MVRLLPFLLAIAVAAGFPPPGPSPSPSGDYILYSGLDYVGDGNDGHKLDLYIPKAQGSDQATNIPAVIFVQGSAFRGQSYSQIAGQAADYPCKQLTAKGIACAAMAYRGDPWPAQHQDMRAAIRWVRGMGKVGKYGLGGMIWVHGGSSGGTLTSHAWAAGHVEDEEFGPDFKRLGPYSTESVKVDAAALYWPIYHPDPEDEPGCKYSAARPAPHGPSSPGTGGTSESAYTHNDSSIAAKLNSLNYLEATAPPVYMVVGTGDEAVSPCNTLEAYTAAVSKGVVDANVSFVPGGGHGCAMRGPVWINGCTSCHGPDPDILAVMLPFFGKHLDAPSPPPSPATSPKVLSFSI